MLAVFAAGCGRKTTSSTAAGGKAVIRVEGSDTMVNLAQAWAEAYNKVHPDVSVQVSGGGSGSASRASSKAWRTWRMPAAKMKD